LLNFFKKEVFMLTCFDDWTWILSVKLFLSIHYNLVSWDILVMSSFLLLQC
jgi:hypothetical protein